MTATIATMTVVNDLITLDCPHGTTTIRAIWADTRGPAPLVHVEEGVAHAVAFHEEEEGCGCALRYLATRHVGPVQ